MSQINFKDETLDASDGVTKLLLAAEYWKGKASALLAKITEMEQQEPLYALPSAQPAPSVPDGWKLVPIEPTQEMSEAGVYAGSIYYDVAEATYEAMLAAAPEAKL